MNDKLIEWTDVERDQFAAKWPCCDVPANGWAIFEPDGDLVGICDAAADCEPGGGMIEFLQDLQGIDS